MSGTTRALIALAVLASVACSETTAPVEAAGNYSLTRLAGRTLPTMLTQGACTWQVTDGNFAVSADSTWQVELNGMWDCPTDTLPPYPFGRGYFGTYRQTGRLLLLRIIGDQAVYTTGQLTFHEAIINLELPLDPLTFSRLP
jgi:hypothetical protein